MYIILKICFLDKISCCVDIFFDKMVGHTLQTVRIAYLRHSFGLRLIVSYCVCPNCKDLNAGVLNIKIRMKPFQTW
jgi:hypothetical protein